MGPTFPCLGYDEPHILVICTTSQALDGHLWTIKTKWTNREMTTASVWASSQGKGNTKSPKITPTAFPWLGVKGWTGYPCKPQNLGESVWFLPSLLATRIYKVHFNKSAVFIWVLSLLYQKQAFKTDRSLSINPEDKPPEIITNSNAVFKVPDYNLFKKKVWSSCT